MIPRLGSLTRGQRALWSEFEALPKQFILYGGVAIALRLGHRFSADFDFFTQQSFDPQGLYRELPFLDGSEVLQMDRDTLTCLVSRGEPVKVSFFGLTGLGVAEAPEKTQGPEVRVASLLDLAATKASVVQKRAASRDYIDMDALLGGGVGLLSALVAGRIVYGRVFNPQITLKALTYYGGGDLDLVPTDVRERLAAAVRSVDLEELLGRLEELSER